jgi:hypothetical protein
MPAATGGYLTREERINVELLPRVFGILKFALDGEIVTVQRLLAT